MPSIDSPDAMIEEFLMRLESAGLVGVVAVDVNPVEQGGLSLDRIVVNERRRGQGVANCVLGMFVQLCDDYGQDAEVIPKPLDYQTTRDGLERLYARHGFERVSPGVEAMMRRRWRSAPPRPA